MARTLRRIRTITASAMMQRHRRQWRVRRHYIKSSSFALTSRPYRESPPAAEAVQVIGRNVVRLGALQRRRHEDVEKDPRGEDEKEHGYLVLLGGPNSKPARNGT